MIILNLIVSAKEEIDDIVNSILKNKFALDVVVGDAIDSYHFNSLGVKMHSVVYTIQFATKSLLFEEIEASLKNEFPGTNFYIFANPIVHINAPFYDKIKDRVTGVNFTDKEKEETKFTKQCTKN
ncbi:MAG: hypothetical protein ACXWV9_08790 [Flavisolibacter sp.]